MDKEQLLFDKIVIKLSKENTKVKAGKMMSAPGIKYKNKVFVFYYDKEMIFRLGEFAEPKKLGVKKFHLLNPFRNKAPMKNWFVIPYSESKHWEKLAKFALDVLSDESM